MTEANEKKAQDWTDQEPDEARALGIRTAPTLVVGNDEARFTGVADIRKFLTAQGFQNDRNE